MLNPGKYNRRITFRTISATTETISDLATVWAAVETLKGGRLLVYEQLQMGAWYEITTPYRSDITVTPGDPLTYESRTLTVHSIVDIDEQHQEWLIYAFEKRG